MMDSQSPLTQAQETTQQTTQYPTQDAPTAPRKKAPIVSIILCIMGMLMGIGFAIYGAVAIDETTSYVSSITFGADFYTEVHKATAAAANNVSDVVNLLEAFNIVPIAIGAFMFLFFALKLVEVYTKHKQS